MTLCVCIVALALNRLSQQHHVACTRHTTHTNKKYVYIHVYCLNCIYELFINDTQFRYWFLCAVHAQFFLPLCWCVCVWVRFFRILIYPDLNYIYHYNKYLITLVAYSHFYFPSLFINRWELTIFIVFKLVDRSCGALKHDWHVYTGNHFFSRQIP